MDSDHEVAAALAEAAGRLLLTLQATGVVEGRQQGATGDAVAHRLLLDALAQLRPDDRVLSEEGAPAAALGAGGSRVWIVDPLDGTREFAEGRTDWAVHVALVTDHRVAAAAVALPGMGQTLSTGTPPLPPAEPDLSRILVSRSRPPEIAESVADRFGGRLVPMGSAGAKAMAVVRGQAAAYLHAGGQYEWDSAAPVGVAIAAGLHASRLDGSPLRYDSPQPLLPDLLICQPKVADELLDAISASGRAA